MSRRIIGKRIDSIRKGVYDLQEAYIYNLDNKWSNYTNIEITSGSAAAQWDTPDGFRTQIFTGPAVFRINSSGDRSGIEYVVIGGGGGGGTGTGGGGGAGHVKFGRRDVTPGNCTITVGAGGAQSDATGGPTGSTSSPPTRASFNGSESRLVIPGGTIFSSGGGSGGSSLSRVTGDNVGASGGGGSFECCPAKGSAGGPSGPDGAGYGGYGNYTIPGNGSGGGGGGAGSPGSLSQDWIYTTDGWIHKGGDGGLGVANPFYDSPTGPFGRWMPTDIRNTYFSESGFVGGGGGGGCSQPGGGTATSYVGGGKAKHGGGNGAVGFAAGAGGRQYSGGGGGGGGQTDSPYKFASGGAGGSGVVMLRYRFKPTEPNEIVALASGGTINLNAGDGYVYHTFTSTGFFEVLVNDLECEVLVVGGGGAAGASAGAGGGGGGGVVYDTSLKLKKGNYQAVIGSGGAAPNAYTPQGSIQTQGNPSTFADIKAFGGGGGEHVLEVASIGNYNPGYIQLVSTAGGSGGGRLVYLAPPASLAGRFAVQLQDLNPPTRNHYGNPGGYSLNTSATFPALFFTQYAAGGGGGAGESGSNGSPAPNGMGGKGGDGIGIEAFPYAKCSVTPDGRGNLASYGGGGAGYTPPASLTAPTRGNGGGGAKGSTNGTQNLGGGGGHGSGLGGSGVVIIRYKVNNSDVPTNHF